MNEENENQESAENNTSRRKFLKTATVVAASTGISQAAAADDDVPGSSDLHICRGLNTEQEGDYGPGTAPASNITPQHGCGGSNNCKGQGGCGSGDYATQYWVTENNCKQTATNWGLGGCGIPLGKGNTGFICHQLNAAAPPKVPPKKTDDSSKTTEEYYYGGYFGKPVWEVARVRFEYNMTQKKLSFGRPAEGCPNFKGNVWKKGDPIPDWPIEPYGTPKPPKPTQGAPKKKS